MAAGAMLLERLPRTTPSAGRGCRRDSEWGPAVPSRGVGRGRGKAGVWGEARRETRLTKFLCLLSFLLICILVGDNTMANVDDVWYFYCLI